jgi:HPt (histidine-containing phosphotransfer) domain-containing protein
MINTDLLDQLRELSGGSDEVINEIFKSFITDANEIKIKVLKHFNNAEFDKMQKEIHSLKGLSATIGANKVHDLSRQIDLELKQTKTLEDKNKLRELSTLIDNTVEYIEVEILD